MSSCHTILPPPALAQPLDLNKMPREACAEAGHPRTPRTPRAAPIPEAWSRAKKPKPHLFPRSPSSALSHPFLGEGSPTKINYRTKGYPYSSLSTGVPTVGSNIVPLSWRDVRSFWGWGHFECPMCPCLVSEGGAAFAR